MRATCLCGAVEITLPERPTSVTFCDCSLCRKLGAVWSYFSKGAVAVTGPTRAFARSDVPHPSVEAHVCDTCGATTHWLATESSGHDRMGANMRLFHPDDLVGMEARFMDGLGWDGVAAPQQRRSPGTIGEDVLVA
ncbi:GFA family protein [Erythrobacter rubeus]|uniref:Aldehyde-activating protein n=1 Tax=Erythrobacter rubeus TaxID=2760803 RepID=A0ABR8KRT4_9SPHN|nr:aldehyde-activating protein [Erythrobacter rubeus]MBD2841159.1 aldehyde-activating protein [Erythrobacter rubeus]